MNYLDVSVTIFINSLGIADIYANGNIYREHKVTPIIGRQYCCGQRNTVPSHNTFNKNTLYGNDTRDINEFKDSAHRAK